MYACLSICATYVCRESLQAIRGHHTSWNVWCWWLWTALGEYWELISSSLQKQQVFNHWTISSAHCFSVLRRALMCSQGWPQTHNPPTSVSPVLLGLQACANCRLYDWHITLRFCFETLRNLLCSLNWPWTPDPPASKVSCTAMTSLCHHAWLRFTKQAQFVCS